jgi:uncharacterized OB-fold protein
MGNEEPRVIRQTISLPYKWALGPVFSRFFDEFKEKRIMGTRCESCHRVLVPARSFCPRCFERTSEWVQVSDEGTIVTFAMINFPYEGQPKPPPYVNGVIDLDGADVGFTHFVGGIDLSDPETVKDKVQIGMRVKAVWKDKREGNIFDIDYFEPI